MLSPHRIVAPPGRAHSSSPHRGHLLVPGNSSEGEGHGSPESYPPSGSGSPTPSGAGPPQADVESSGLDGPPATTSLGHSGPSGLLSPHWLGPPGPGGPPASPTVTTLSESLTPHIAGPPGSPRLGPPGSSGLPPSGTEPLVSGAGAPGVPPASPRAGRRRQRGRWSAVNRRYSAVSLLGRAARNRKPVQVTCPTPEPRDPEPDRLESQTLTPEQSCTLAGGKDHHPGHPKPRIPKPSTAHAMWKTARSTGHLPTG